MNKIKDLLKQMGASEELTEQIIKTFAEYTHTIETKLDEEFKARLQNAKKVCMEEVEKEKADLARKVEIFLEARIATINREAEKQAAIGESDASKTLRELKSLLEGVDNGAQLTEDAQAAVAENKKLRLMVSQLQDKSAHLEEKATKANQIAMKALSLNRMLESKANGGKTETAETVAEGKKPVTEGKETLEGVKTPSAQPQTTRKVMTESQVPAKKEPAAGSPEISAIAAQLDDSPAFAL